MKEYIDYTAAELDEMSTAQRDTIWIATKKQRRERIATAVLAGMYADLEQLRGEVNGSIPPDVWKARHALAAADALIAELDKEEQK